jgi:hypothetical protein
LTNGNLSASVAGQTLIITVDITSSAPSPSATVAVDGAPFPIDAQGVGTHVGAANYPPGPHTVTMSITDNAGWSEVKSTSVQIPG